MPIFGTTPQGNAPLLANAPHRTGSRVKSANGSVILPLVVQPNTENNSEHFKVPYPLFIRKNGSVIHSTSRATQPLTSCTRDGTDLDVGADGFIFYGIAVGYSKKRKRKLSQRSTFREADRIDVCLRGLYAAPQRWFMTPVTPSWLTAAPNFRHYERNGGFVVYDMNNEIPYCLNYEDTEYVMTEDTLKKRFLVIGQFFQKVTDWSAIDNNETVPLDTYRRSVQGKEVLTIGKSQRQKRKDRRTVNVYFRC